MVHAKEYCRFASMLEQRWKSVRTQGEMDDCPCLHLVDNMEFREQEHSLPELKDELLCDLLLLVYSYFT